jgi:glycosyltransferase involved in cell wall biosynthesis
MNRRKLLIVTDDACMGGTYRVAEQLVLGLRTRFTTSFALAFDQKNIAARERLAASGVALIDYQATERNPQRAAYALEDAQRLLRAAEPDVILLVEGGEIWSLLALKSVAARRGIPFVSSINLLTDDCVRRFSDLRATAIDMLRAASSLVFVSDASRKRFETLLPRIERPKHVVVNSRPRRYFEIGGEPARRSARAALGVGEDETLFLCAARIEPRKGQMLCLEALERLRAQGRAAGVRLALAGGGASGDVDTIREAIDEKKLRAEVLHLGPRDDVPSLLEACDAFVLASYSEGMPLSIIEAMAKARPVIASAVDGIPEQIDRFSGILLPSPALSREQCVAALADAMALLRADPRARDAMGRCARLRALEMFDEPRMIAEYEAIVSEAAPAPRRTSRLAALRAHPLLRDAAERREREALRAPASRLPPISQWSNLESWRRMARAPAIRADFRRGLTPGSVIEFHDPQQCWAYAQSGFDLAEHVGCWNDGTVSVLRLPLGRSMRSLRLVFDLTPFAPAGRRQETDVLVDGEKVAGWSFDTQVVTRRVIDIRRRPSRPFVEVRFEHKTTCSPRAAGLSDDSRELAIFLHRLELQRIPLRDRLGGLSRLDAPLLHAGEGMERAPAE